MASTQRGLVRRTAESTTGAGGTTPPDPTLDPNALAATPYVYLIPCGADSMRSPPLGDASTIRTWDVDDVAIPLPFNVSAAAFGLDVPYINPGSLLRLPDGRTQFSLTAPGATQAKVQGSANLADWTDLQTLPVTGGSATFTDSETGSTKRFYRLYMAP